MVPHPGQAAPHRGARRLPALARIEATSFVSPKWVPQLADAVELVRALGPLARSEVPRLSALVPNAKGLERALEAGLPRDRGVLVGERDAQQDANVNKSIAQTLSTSKR
jgi:hydroxymethylglutaryl-CoA lyase